MFFTSGSLIPRQASKFQVRIVQWALHANTRKRNRDTAIVMESVVLNMFALFPSADT